MPSVQLPELPRMADYAEWGEAVSRGLGWPAGEFLSTYNDNRKDATRALLDDSAVARIVLALVRQHFTWTGTAQDLYFLSGAIVTMARNT